MKINQSNPDNSNAGAERVRISFELTVDPEHRAVSGEFEMREPGNSILIDRGPLIGKSLDAAHALTIFLASSAFDKQFL